jgi:1,4-alpha-glucan branching enzyme
VIYAIHVATFNPAGNGGAGGFASVVERLEDLHELGVNCIDLMPSLQFANDFSYGFDPSNIFSISSEHGGPEELMKLVDAAHGLGIGVLFDVVYNHFGAGPLDLWQFNGCSENGKGGMYFYNDSRSQTPWGDTRPNYGLVDVRNFLIDNARMWLREYRMDGLRWDGTSFIRNIYGNNADPAHDIPEGWTLMQHITWETNQNPWKLHIAEDLRNNDWIVCDHGSGGAGFHAQWDSEFVNPVRTAIISPYDGGRDMCAVQHAIEHHYGGDPFKRVIYTESHDEIATGRKRVPEAICPGDAGCLFSRKRSTLGAVLVFTSPGIPMLFQGQEVLENRWGKHGEPVDWDRATNYSGIRQMYRDLIELRRNELAETAGLLGPHARVYHLNDDDNVIAFHRWRSGGPRDDVVVVVNFGNRAYREYTIGFPRRGEWRVRFNSDCKAYDTGFDDHPSDTVHAYGDPRDGLETSGTVSIGKYTAIILSQSA